MPLTHTEGESNTSAARADWSSRATGPKSAPLLKRDSDAFLHQSLSTPCAATIAKAEGIWIEDLDGNRFMDFHGNSVHHIGYGHPRLVAAIKDQLDTLPFAPRRFTNSPAVELAEKLAKISPGDLGKVLFTTGGSDANEVALKIARAATGRFKTLSFWDAFHGAGFGAASVGGEATFRSHIAGPLLPGAEHVAPFRLLSLPLRSRRTRRLRAGLRKHGGFRAGARRRHRRHHRRTDARRALRAATGLLGAGPRCLQPAWCAVNYG